MLEVPGFKISNYWVSNLFSHQPCSFLFNWNFRNYFRVQDGCLLKEFFCGKRHFIYGPKSIWSKQIRGYKFSPHSRKVYNSQRKVELSFIVAGLVSKFLWTFLGFFKAFSSTYRILLKSNRIACKKKLFMKQKGKQKYVS